MSFIEVKHINKTFKVPIKSEGKFITLKTFFNRKYKYIKAILTFIGLYAIILHVIYCVS